MSSWKFRNPGLLSIPTLRFSDSSTTVLSSIWNLETQFHQQLESILHQNALQFQTPRSTMIYIEIYIYWGQLPQICPSAHLPHSPRASMRWEVALGRWMTTGHDGHASKIELRYKNNHETFRKTVKPLRENHLWVTFRIFNLLAKFLFKRQANTCAKDSKSFKCRNSSRLGLVGPVPPQSLEV